MPLVLAVFFLSPNARAYNFQPSEHEWVLWPEYCKSRYVGTTAGRKSSYSRSVPVRTQKKWQRALGGIYPHIHHYCTGTIFLNRAKLSFDAEKKKNAYLRAIHEIEYTYRYVTPDAPFFSKMSAHLARAHNGAGNTVKAIDILTKAIERQPSRPHAYVQFAEIHREKGRHDEAIRILEKGLAAVDKKAYKLHVKLAYIYFDLKDLETAEYHAGRAYQLGYRSPALKRKLSRENNDQ